jgi:hypothetical protein
MRKPLLVRPVPGTPRRPWNVRAESNLDLRCAAADVPAFYIGGMCRGGVLALFLLRQRMEKAMVRNGSIRCKGRLGPE